MMDELIKAKADVYDIQIQIGALQNLLNKKIQLIKEIEKQQHEEIQEKLNLEPPQFKEKM